MPCLRTSSLFLRLKVGSGSRTGLTSVGVVPPHKLGKKILNLELEIPASIQLVRDSSGHVPGRIYYQPGRKGHRTNSFQILGI